jgi:hypothetical protein
MPTALSDPSTTLYILLGTMAIIFGAIFANRQSRKSFIQFAIAGGCLLALYLIDKAVESPREESVRKVEEIARATQNNTVSSVMNHFSDEFKYGSTTKKDVANKLNTLRQRWSEWTGGEAWDFSRENYKQISENTLTIGFRGQARGFPIVSEKYVRATFKKESDNQWRMTQVEFFERNKGDQGSPVMIPDFGN